MAEGRAKGRFGLDGWRRARREMQSGARINADFSSARVGELVPEVSVRAVVHGGRQPECRSAGEANPFAAFSALLERFEAGSYVRQGRDVLLLCCADGPVCRIPQAFQ